MYACFLKFAGAGTPYAALFSDSKRFSAALASANSAWSLSQWSYKAVWMWEKGNELVSSSGIQWAHAFAGV